MSSLFRSRQPEADPPSTGSGGKILRGRRRSSASPYPVLRPLQQASPGWSLGGLISGAGKLISSVLPYRSSQTTSSDDDNNASPFSDDDDDDREGFISDEEVHDLPSKGHQELHERGKDAQLNNNCRDGSQAVTPKSKSKCVLVHLLMQETFSSDAVDAPNVNGAHTSNLQTVTDSYCQLNHVPGEVINILPDTRPQEGNSQIPNVADGSNSELTGNISFSEVNPSSNHETLSKEPNIIVPKNGTRMKSTEGILTEPKPSVPRRRRKVVVTKRKSKGKPLN